MDILLFTLCAMALVALGAFIAGGQTLPKRARRAEEARERAQPDELGRDLAALLGYQQGDDEQTEGGDVL